LPQHLQPTDGGANNPACNSRAPARPIDAAMAVVAACSGAIIAHLLAAHVVNNIHVVVYTCCGAARRGAAAKLISTRERIDGRDRIPLPPNDHPLAACNDGRNRCSERAVRLARIALQVLDACLSGSGAVF